MNCYINDLEELRMLCEQQTECIRQYGPLLAAARLAFKALDDRVGDGLSVLEYAALIALKKALEAFK